MLCFVVHRICRFIFKLKHSFTTNTCHRQHCITSIDTSNRHQSGDDTAHSNKRSASKNAIISQSEIVAVHSEKKESVKVVPQSDFDRVLCEFKFSDSSVLTECASEPVVDPVVQYKAGQPLQPPVIDTLEQIVVRKWRAPNRRAPIIKNSENPPIDAPDSIFKQRTKIDFNLITYLQSDQPIRRTNSEHIR